MNRRRLLNADNREAHLARHGVSLDEAYEVFYSPALVQRMRLERYTLIGQTDGGRYLVVVIASRGNDVYGLVTARDADPHERRAFLRWRN
jgi:uncharacterized DUF497 family protein